MYVYKVLQKGLESTLGQATNTNFRKFIRTFFFKKMSVNKQKLAKLSKLVKIEYQKNRFFRKIELIGCPCVE